MHKWVEKLLFRHNKKLFEINDWIKRNTKSELDEVDILQLEHHISYFIINDFIPKGSVLYYLIHRKPGATVDETKEERVKRLIKRDFEYNNGMSFDDFMQTYKKIILDNPELLI